MVTILVIFSLETNFEILNKRQIHYKKKWHANYMSTLNYIHIKKRKCSNVHVLFHERKNNKYVLVTTVLDN